MITVITFVAPPWSPMNHFWIKVQLSDTVRRSFLYCCIRPPSLMSRKVLLSCQKNSAVSYWRCHEMCCQTCSPWCPFHVLLAFTAILYPFWPSQCANMCQLCKAEIRSWPRCLARPPRWELLYQRPRQETPPSRFQECPHHCSLPGAAGLENNRRLKQMEEQKEQKGTERNRKEHWKTTSQTNRLIAAKPLGKKKTDN